MNVDWQAAYGAGDRRVFVFADISGDWGDNPDARHVTVRGQEGLMDSVAEQSEGHLDEYLITWDETSPCAAPYAVRTKGLDEATTLRVAQSLTAASATES